MCSIFQLNKLKLFSILDSRERKREILLKNVYTGIKIHGPVCNKCHIIWIMFVVHWICQWDSQCFSKFISRVWGRYTFEGLMPLSPFATAGKIVQPVPQGCSIFQEITFLTTAVLRYVGAFKKNKCRKKGRAIGRDREATLDGSFHRFNSSHPISFIILTKSKPQIVWDGFSLQRQNKRREPEIKLSFIPSL